jgi:hypothetical protein
MIYLVKCQGLGDGGGILVDYKPYKRLNNINSLYLTYKSSVGNPSVDSGGSFRLLGFITQFFYFDLNVFFCERNNDDTINTVDITGYYTR